MADYTEEQRVKQRYPCAVNHCYEADSHRIWNHFGHPDNWTPLGSACSTASEAWADASRRLGNEFVDEIGPLAERKEG